MAAMDVDTRIQELTHTHHGRLVRAMLLVSGDLATAEDAVQHAFSSLLQVLRRGETVDVPGAWLATASTNYVRSGWRSAARRRRYEAAVRVPRSDAPDLADVLAVRGALARLPARQRQAAVLHYLLDLSVDETALAMKTSTGMVKNALFRARQSLADALGEQIEDADG